MKLREILAYLAAARRSTGEMWQAGDLAVCIQERWGEDLPENPRLNDLLRVKHVCRDGLFLHFEGKPISLHWEAAAFRKVKPDSEPAADEAWVEQLRHLRRKVDA